MFKAEIVPTAKQRLFGDIVLGTLVYAVVLGFFNDYTDILSTRSYSITFALAVAMELLTFATLQLKSVFVRRFKLSEQLTHKVVFALSIWLTLFLSKFVFLAVIAVIFGSAVEIVGFIGLMVVILTMTLAEALINVVYGRLG
jgi:hypothetical protein